MKSLTNSLHNETISTHLGTEISYIATLTATKIDSIHRYKISVAKDIDKIFLKNVSDKTAMTEQRLTVGQYFSEALVEIR